MNRLAILILMAVSSVPALARSGPPPTLFDDVAPGAKNILAFRIESLELEPGLPDDGVHSIKAKIRVLKKYRDADSVFEWLTYINGKCHGIRLDVGGIYLVATNSSGPVIELGLLNHALLQLSAYPVDTDYLLRASPTIEGLLAALDGKGDFKLSNEATTARMRRELPPPEVPPPEGMCLTLVRCDNVPQAPARADR